MVSQWLPLTDYSSKYRVSVSTLRRRIKAEDIKFRLEDGKYFIIDEPMSTHQKHRPSQTSDTLAMGAHQQLTREEIDWVPASANEFDQTREFVPKPSRDEPILTAANKLLTELKKAYTQILREKEDQILSLKEEISDLKTLVKVLESESLKNRQRR